MAKGELRPQVAVPPATHVEQSRRLAVCVCGKGIVGSCFGWVHMPNMWIATDSCGGARPRAA
ncbi:hypothetical protein Acsp01_09940 [Actinoplanes sp. NBRC 101535]|nr:hypothetical protein Acsp01_09940 [Actinoplanes sp. NBRC 101535]